MTYLFNDPVYFADELVQGFAAAHRNKIRRVDGGVIRGRKAKPGQVVIVTGGGSGHYPAFAGWVGQGMAHGAAMGNVFAAPSARQIRDVAQAADAGGGVLFCYANYAGDVLNFNEAQTQLRSIGIDVHSVAVTDDIASAPFTERHRRRGIAGVLAVLKAAGAAADAGEPLNEVARIAMQANEHVRSLGVAFSGCTLPGAVKPLFEVTGGSMEVGMGIHGESGLYRLDAPTADGLAEMLLDKLLAEIPVHTGKLQGARVGVILNGLGAVKYEELFVVYRKIEQLLSVHGLIAVEPVVGELVTSFDMAGVSLTLFWLDDVLERTWLASADTPAFHRSGVTASVPFADNAIALVHARSRCSVRQGATVSRAAAAIVYKALAAAQVVVEANLNELGRLDAVAGDGDHGIGMQCGLAAAVSAARQVLDEQVGAGTLLIMAGEAWSDRAGGTSGALWGVILRTLGHALGDDAKPDTSVVAAGIASVLAAVREIGKAEPGDKTLVDVLHPFSVVLTNGAVQGLSVVNAWSVAARAADEAAHATANLIPKIGRARPHAEKSIGTPDPGAVSMALIINAVEKILWQHCD
ncbi:MAG: dihydroxyacetone kinase family protein [Nitrosomonas sp.]|nr:MAG: dihydroxyacetone kinase family protein [Nitrosomonas sp.]